MTKTQPRTTLQRSVTRTISCFFRPLQHVVDLNGQSRSLGMIKVCNLLFAVLDFAVFFSLHFVAIFLCVRTR